MADAIQGLVGVVSMEGGQHQMTGLGKGNGVLHGFWSANLTDQYNVRRLAQGVLQRHIKGLCIHSHFPLSNDAALMLMDKFNRIFNRDYMAATVFIAVADQGRQGCGFTCACGANKNNNAAFVHYQLF